MPEIDIKDKTNKSVEKMVVPENIFGVTAKDGVLHSALVNFLANQRQGTHATKTKGLVSGGGKKPWKQKSTGRARSGSSRSPLWRGGGTVFGPQPRDYSYKLPKKARKAALNAAISGKLADGELIVIDGFGFEKPSTKAMVLLLSKFGLTGKSTLIVVPEKNDAVFLSARNIPGVKVARVADLNPYEVAANRWILFDRQAVEMLSEAGKK
jgi:large subunit ribosomal protein L4